MNPPSRFSYRAPMIVALLWLLYTGVLLFLDVAAALFAVAFTILWIILSVIQWRWYEKQHADYLRFWARERYANRHQGGEINPMEKFNDYP